MKSQMDTFKTKIERDTKEINPVKIYLQNAFKNDLIGVKTILTFNLIIAFIFH